MSQPSIEQKQRLSALIDSLFPGCAQKARLMANLADQKGDYTGLADMSDSELAEMATMENKFLGG